MFLLLRTFPTQPQLPQKCLQRLRQRTQRCGFIFITLDWELRCGLRAQQLGRLGSEFGVREVSAVPAVGSAAAVEGSAAGIAGLGTRCGSGLLWRGGCRAATRPGNADQVMEPAQPSLQCKTPNSAKPWQFCGGERCCLGCPPRSYNNILM